MWVFIIRGLSLFFTNLMIVLFGEPMVRWAFFKLLNWLVKITPFTWDDKLLAKIEEEYEKKHGSK